MNEFTPVICTFSILFIIAVFFRLATLERRVAAISRVEAKVDALIRHAGIQFDPLEGMPPAVAESLKNGQKIEAIKWYRQATGVGLKDAKDMVEELLSGGQTELSEPEGT